MQRNREKARRAVNEGALERQNAPLRRVTRQSRQEKESLSVLSVALSMVLRE